MDDNHVMIEMIADRIFVDDLLINIHFQFCQIDISALQRIVHLLCDAEEIWPALDHPPSRSDPDGIHQQCERGENFGHATAIISRTDIGDAHIAQTLSLFGEAFKCLTADEGFIVFYRREMERRRRRTTRCIHSLISVIIAPVFLIQPAPC